MLKANLRANKWEEFRLDSFFKLSSGATKPDDLVPEPNQLRPFPVYGGNGVMGYSSAFNAEGENIVVGRVGANCGCIHHVIGRCWITDNALFTSQKKETFNTAYMAYLLEHLDLARLRGQSGQPLVSQGPIHSLRALVAPLPEQRKITEILQTWDSAIEKASQLIAVRKKQYLGLRDQLVDWSSKYQSPLRQFLNPVSRQIAKPDTKYRALSIRSHGKGTFARIVENPASVDMETLYVAKAGDIIVNITFAWEGAIALVPPEHDGCLVSHRFPTFVPVHDKANVRYLRHALRMQRFTYLLGLVSPGGAGRNRVLNKSDFLDLKGPLPSTSEQARIAVILDDAENAVAREIQLRDALERQKRGLMQKLLTASGESPRKAAERPQNDRQYAKAIYPSTAGWFESRACFAGRHHD
jgi:restriction endonuclease S subunit